MHLSSLLIESARRTPHALALWDENYHENHFVTYGELDQLANQVAHLLASQGVGSGDRVGIWLDKSVAAVAVMQAVLRLGAAYVPVDPLGSASRAHDILTDCAVKAIVSTRHRAESCLLGNLATVFCLCIDGRLGDQGLSWDDLAAFSTTPVSPPPISADELAYILYTSGSTGQPKGVCISHRNALAFIDWAAQELAPSADDRFANHAPFHFDLSVLDLYVAFQIGASVFLIADGMSYIAGQLVQFVNRHQLTIWYSVPSALVLMIQAELLKQDVPDLRAVLFAGEPFPLKYLKMLRERWPSVRLLNLYGPTETNVCTFYEVKTLEANRVRPVPIGKACSGDRVWALTEQGKEASVGETGELMVAGPTVMLGYWNQSPQGDRPYGTGDIVQRLDGDNYLYIGRRDHLVKIRGHRIELREIEAVLANHPDIYEVAVIVSGSGIEAQLIAFMTGASEVSLLAVKQYCAQHLPRYMIIHKIRLVPVLPKTRNGKIDRRLLAQWVNKDSAPHITSKNEKNATV